MQSSPTLHNYNKLTSPLLSRTRSKRKAQQFVLDCTNPFESRMQEYIPQQDPYSQPYLSVLLSKVQQDDSPSPFEFKIRKKTVQTISSADFKNFLSSKIKAIKNVQQTSVLQPIINKATVGKEKSSQLSKQAQFVSNKYRCFVRSRGKGSKRCS